MCTKYRTYVYPSSVNLPVYSIMGAKDNLELVRSISVRCCNNKFLLFDDDDGGGGDVLVENRGE